MQVVATRVHYWQLGEGGSRYEGYITRKEDPVDLEEFSEALVMASVEKGGDRQELR